MNKLVVYLAAVLFFISIKGYANDLCHTAQNEGDINLCWSEKKNSAEDELNKEYVSAKKRIAESYRANKTLLTQYITILVDSQRGWLKYRDGQCKLEAFLAEDSSIAHATLTDKCITRIDRDRVEQLKSMPYE